MSTKQYVTFSSSRASDNAFRALKDVSEITADLDDTRVIGGLMVALLTEAFPSPSTTTRHTSDVDAAISIDIAICGTVHQRLIEVGYSAVSGNRYIKGERVVDLLVPTNGGQFGRSEHGARGFDSAPGITLALAGRPIVHEIEVELTTGQVLQMKVRTPTVEQAVVMKALTTRTRHESKDLQDIYNLRLIHDHHQLEVREDWRLNEPGIKGSRGDAQKALTQLIDQAWLRKELTGIGISAPDFSQLVQQHILPAV